MSIKMKTWAMFGAVSWMGCEVASQATREPAERDISTAMPQGQIEEILRGDPGRRLSSLQIRALYSNTSCNGMGGSRPSVIEGVYHRGLRGRVTVPNKKSALMNAAERAEWGANLERYEQSDATRLDNKLFFSQINVPTRLFSAGFPTLEGGVVQRPDGESLIEFFRLDFDGFLELGERPEGDYEIAALADDGVRLRLGADRRIVVESNMPHGTKLVCGRQVVRMQRGMTVPLELEYYQGPKFHIALVLMWRPVTGSAEPLCGQMGNEKWFNYSVSPAVPKQPYNDLLARGWEVIPAASFRIPDEEIMNPCHSERVQEEFESNPI